MLIFFNKSVPPLDFWYSIIVGYYFFILRYNKLT